MIQKLSNKVNPIYAIKFSENEHPIIGFSKTFDDSFNPKSNFAAVMTCNSLLMNLVL
jgi:arsenate reductase